MIVVLDASAAAEVMLRREKGDHFGRLLAEAESVVVPELYFYEMTNLFWKYHRLAGIDPDQCARGLRLAAELPDETVSATDLYIECLDTACREGHQAYDLFYLVLAKRRGAILATLDKKLLTMCTRVGVRIPA